MFRYMLIALAVMLAIGVLAQPPHSDDHDEPKDSYCAVVDNYGICVLWLRERETMEGN